MALSLDKRKQMLAAGTGDLDGRVFSRAEPRHKQVQAAQDLNGPLLTYNPAQSPFHRDCTT
jgi:hypothetical protein